MSQVCGSPKRARPPLIEINVGSPRNPRFAPSTRAAIKLFTTCWEHFNNAATKHLTVLWAGWDVSMVFILVTSTSTADCNYNFFDADCKLFSCWANIKGFAVSCKKIAVNCKCPAAFHHAISYWIVQLQSGMVCSFAVDFKQQTSILLLDVEFCSWRRLNV